MIGSEICTDEHRRAALLKHHHPDFNGIDFIEVGAEGGGDAHLLTIHFLRHPPAQLTKNNVLIEGGRRITGITVVDVWPAKASRVRDPATQGWTVQIDKVGDFSQYTLRLVDVDPDGRPSDTPLAHFDPRYAQADFSFKVDCPTGLDCAAETPCAPSAPAEPDIDYLAKDFSSFRQLILDRLALVAPSWTERHLPDIGIALVEVLAYAGDYLSYYQDAVATEAYLSTARQRISVRRHARLVDYPMHEGCNSRAWVCLEHHDPAPYVLDLTNVKFRTGQKETGGVLFEALATDSITLYQEHNRIYFYTWGNRECCLPRGTVSATVWAGPGTPKALHAKVGPRPPAKLEKKHAKPERHKHKHYQPPEPPVPEPTNPALSLKPGDVLVFEEVLGPKTGVPADADRSHRHAVRLTKVERAIDPLDNVQVYDIEWADDDKLPFTLCISTLGRPPKCPLLENVSVARGNVVLVDQGETVTNWKLGVPSLPPLAEHCVSVGRARELAATLPAFRPPPVPSGPLTHRTDFPNPAIVSRYQAIALSGLMDRVNSTLQKILTYHELSKKDVRRLEAILGRAALADIEIHYHEPDSYTVAVETVSLLDAITGLPRIPKERRVQVAALRALAAARERLLAPKAARVSVLLAHAQAGYVLEESELREIGELFGVEFVQGLDPQNPRWLGPAQSALLQDPHAALPAISLRDARYGPAPPLCSPFQVGRSQAVQGQAQALDALFKQANELIAPFLAELADDQTDPIPDDILRGLIERLIPGLTLTDDFGAQRSVDQDERAIVQRRLGELVDRLSRLRDSAQQGFLAPLAEIDAIQSIQSDFFPAVDRLPRVPSPMQGVWCPKRDLLSSHAHDRDFVVEIDNYGLAHLRFGDGDLGEAPEPGSTYLVTYRVGNGTAGNVAAETITRIQPRGDGAKNALPKVLVRNPLPAAGGVDPEPAAEVKLYAPGAFRKPTRRAVTAQDYAALAGAHPGVQRAGASFRWTGGATEVQVAIDPLGTESPSASLLSDIERELDQYRRIGHDVRVLPAHYIPLDVILDVTVRPNYLRGHVEAALLRLFSAGTMPDGRLGLFHPDRLTFGSDVEVSRLVAAAQAVEGVQSATVTRLKRLGDDRAPDTPPGGVLRAGELEIPRLDSNPSFPENGTLTLRLRGGR